ncbi:serine hydrolase domain-containing protein [Kitasatospora sp. NPDC054939]
MTSNRRRPGPRSALPLRTAVAALGTAGLLAAGCTAPPPSAGPGAAPAPAAQVDPVLATTAADRVQEQIEALLATYPDGYRPGVVVAVDIPGHLSFTRRIGAPFTLEPAVGDTPLDLPTPASEVRIGTMTTSFTVTALLRLVDQGLVALDDPVADYVPDVPNGERITLRHLAGMRSGLFPYEADEAFAAAVGADPEREFTPRELLAHSFAHAVLFEPGIAQQENLTNTVLLELVVEEVTGRPIREVVRGDVVPAQNASDFAIPADSTLRPQTAHGYALNLSGGLVDASELNPSWMGGLGPMVANVSGLQGWARALATGEGLSERTQAERTVMRATARPGVTYGLGIREINGWVGYTDSTPGYESVALYLPEERATVAVLVNSWILNPFGIEPSTLVVQAVTEQLFPDHPYVFPG